MNPASIIAEMPAAPRLGVRRMLRASVVVLQALALAGLWGGARVLELAHVPPPPAVRELDIHSRFARLELVEVTVRAGWTPVATVVPLDTVLRDPTLWRRMHFHDWDRLAAAHREAGLSAVCDRYGHVVDASAWPEMQPGDWDEVPQPIRAMAFLGMAEYWSRRYALGVMHGLPADLAANTLAAIVMVESWFEHRASVMNADGNVDLGLGQCSDYCRARLVKLVRAGVIDFAPANAEAYANPWHAVRAAALWFGIMLDEADGDLDLATRAYYRGMPAARRGEGAAYLDNVIEKRMRFVENGDATPAWSYLYERLRPATAELSEPGADDQIGSDAREVATGESSLL